MKNFNLIRDKNLSISSISRKIFIILIICTAMFSIFRIYQVNKSQLNYKLDLAYETANLSTIIAIKENKNIYSPDLFSKKPYIMTIYTPLYHYLVSCFKINKENLFFTGRIIALIFMILTPFLLFLIPNNRSCLSSIFAISLFFLFRPIIFEAAYLKNDTLAMFLSALSVIIISRNNNKLSIFICALLSVLAFFTKQTYIASFLTCFIYLIINDKRKGLLLLTEYLFLLFTFLLLAYLKWGNGFFVSIFITSKNSISLHLLIKMLKSVFQEPVFAWLFITSCVMTAYSYKDKKYLIFKGSPFLLYACFSFSVLVLTIGKNGSTRTYFFEFFIAIVFYFSFLINDFYSNKKLFNLKTYFIFLIFIVCLSCEFLFSNKYQYTHLSKKNLIFYNKLSQEVKYVSNKLGLKDPDVLNLVWPKYPFEVSSKNIVNDPFLYFILWNKGILDVNNIINDIIDKKFDMIVIKENYTQFKKRVSPFDYLIKAVLTCYKIFDKKYFVYMVPKKDFQPTYKKTF